MEWRSEAAHVWFQPLAISELICFRVRLSSICPSAGLIPQQDERVQLQAYFSGFFLHACLHSPDSPQAVLSMDSSIRHIKVLITAALTVLAIAAMSALESQTPDRPDTSQPIKLEMIRKAVIASRGLL